MKNLFKKQSAKFVQNPSSFTKVMVKHILVCFLMPHSVDMAEHCAVLCRTPPYTDDCVWVDLTWYQHSKQLNHILIKITEDTFTVQ